MTKRWQDAHHTSPSQHTRHEHLPNTRSWLVATALLVLTLSAQQAAACRCAPRALTDYFAAADVVMIAEVTALGVTANEQALALTLAPSCRLTRATRAASPSSPPPPAPDAGSRR